MSKVVFRLVENRNGQIIPYRNSDYTDVNNINNLKDLRKAIKLECPNKLKYIDENDLLVFKSISDANDASKRLRYNSKLDTYATEETSLYVLVQNSDIPVAKRFKSSWVYLGKINNIKFSDLSRTGNLKVPVLDHCIFNGVNKAIIANSLINTKNDIIANLFYRRSAFIRQCNFMHDSLKEKSLPIIHGSPGSGKSTTAYIYSLSLSFEVPILWIGIGDPSIIKFQIINKGIVKHQFSKILEFDDILQNLMSEGESPPGIMILDGLVNISGFYLNIFQSCVVYHRAEISKLVLVCSNSTFLKLGNELEQNLKVQRHFVPSWDLSDYKLALQDIEFKAQVISKLDAGLKDIQDISELIEAKYFLAGGCARYMFGYHTVELIEKIEQAIESIDNIETVVRGFKGHFSLGTINGLFCAYQGIKMNYQIASKYIATEMASQLGPQLITRLSEVVNASENPALKGWLFEMWMFANIQNKSIEINSGSICKSLKRQIPYRFNPDNLSDTRDLLHEIGNGIWLKPIKWNQSGYDAVFLNASTVEFYQFTSADTHSFKKRYFDHLTNALEELIGNPLTQQIYFVIPIEKLNIFKVIHDLKSKANFDIYTVKGFNS